MKICYNCKYLEVFVEDEPCASCVKIENENPDNDHPLWEECEEGNNDKDKEII